MDLQAGIRTVYLHVTSACQARCEHCYVSAGARLPRELDTDEWVGFWPQLVGLSPEKVIVTGGEPLLRPDVFTLLRTLRAAAAPRAIRCCVNTNGALVDRATAERLTGLVDEVRVSVDGLPEVHDRRRGAGSHERAMRALSNLRDAGVPARASVTVSRSNVNQLGEVVDLLRDRGVTQIRLTRFRPIGRGAGRADEVLDDPAMWAAWEPLVRRMRSPGTEGRSAPSRPVGRTCGAGSFLNVMADGEVYPCHVLVGPPFRLGNIRDDTLAEMNAPGGLLARLRSLDVGQLSAPGGPLAALARPDACLGDVLSGAAAGLEATLGV